MTIDKKQWFDVQDSKCKGEDEKEYFNVEARFADHPILDVEASRLARSNVYKRGIVLHTRIKRNWLDKAAITNATSFVLRFDKGPDETVTTMVPGPVPGTMVQHREGKLGMTKEDFDRAVSLIVRCWNAWEHYQQFREAPVTDMEARAVGIINSMPLSAFGRLVSDKAGNIIEVDAIDETPPDDDPDGNFPGEEPEPVKPAAKRRKAA